MGKAGYSLRLIHRPFPDLIFSLLMNGIFEAAGVVIVIFISKADKKTDFGNPPHCGGRRKPHGDWPPCGCRNKPYNTDFVKTLWRFYPAKGGV